MDDVWWSLHGHADDGSDGLLGRMARVEKMANAAYVARAGVAVLGAGMLALAGWVLNRP